jgi:hypothetical protein
MLIEVACPPHPTNCRVPRPQIRLYHRKRPIPNLGQKDKTMAPNVEMENVALLKSSYEWANRVMSGDGLKVNLEDVERFFASDATMVTNDKMKCKGLDAHVKHFQEIQKKAASVVFHPFEITVAQGERVGAYFKIDVKYADGRTATIFIAGFFLIRNGKIRNFTEVAHFEGAEMHLDNH